MIDLHSKITAMQAVYGGRLSISALDVLPGNRFGYRAKTPGTRRSSLPERTSAPVVPWE